MFEEEEVITDNYNKDFLLYLISFSNDFHFPITINNGKLMDDY